MGLSRLGVAEPRPSSRSRREIAPAETGKAGEAAVRRPPLAAVLHGEGCKVGVGGIRAANAGSQHKVPEDRPVARTWLNPAYLGLRGQGVDVAEYLLRGRRGLEDPGIAADPHNRGEDELADRHFPGTRTEPLELAPADGVMGRPLDQGCKQHVDVAEDHSISQRRLVSSRSMPATGTG